MSTVSAAEPFISSSSSHAAGGVLVLARLQHLGTLSHINTLLAIAAVVYFGVNVVCCILNTHNLDPVACNPTVTTEECRGMQPIASAQLFHKLEFGSTFLFAVVETLSILYSPKRQFENPLLLKALTFFNMAATFIAAALVFINVEAFEVPSHQLEYTNGLSMALVDLLMAVQLVRGHTKSTPKTNELLYAFLGFAPLCVAATMLAVYDGMGETEDGDRLGEKPAHYFEFIFEMISATITFWFCMDNRLRCDTMRFALMLDEGDVEDRQRAGERGTCCGVS